MNICIMASAITSKISNQLTFGFWFSGMFHLYKDPIEDLIYLGVKFKQHS